EPRATVLDARELEALQLGGDARVDEEVAQPGARTIVAVAAGAMDPEGLERADALLDDGWCQAPGYVRHRRAPSQRRTLRPRRPRITPRSTAPSTLTAVLPTIDPTAARAQRYRGAHRYTDAPQDD